MSEDVTGELPSPGHPLLSTTSFTPSTAGYKEHPPLFSAPDNPLLSTTSLTASTAAYKEHTSAFSTQEYPTTATLPHIASSAGHQEHTSSSSALDITNRLLMAAVTPSESDVPVDDSGLISAAGDQGLRQIEHAFSEPVIIVIILGVIAGVIGTILLISFVISKLTRKSSLDIQPPKLDNTGVPFSSVEAGYSEQ